MPWSTIGLAVAGAAGVLARHFVQRMVPRTGHIPWGTLVVNVGGAFVLGFLLTLVARRGSVPMWLQEMMFVGFLGGFTTFSALSAETLLLVESRQFGLAVAYGLGSLVAGVLAVLGGGVTARQLV